MGAPLPIRYVPLFTSSASTAATRNSAEQTNPGYAGLILSVDVTAKTGTSPTLDVKVQQKDPLSGVWTDIKGAAVAQVSNTAPTHKILYLYPGIAANSGETVSNVLPRTWRVVVTIGGSSTPGYTYSISAQLLP